MPLLYYFAGLVKETLIKMDDREIRQSVIRFMLDE